MTSKKTTAPAQKPSAKIKEFLDFIDRSQRDFNLSTDMLTQYEKETQDILHAIELNDLPYKERARLATKLKFVRQARRKDKIAVHILQPLIDFFSASQGRECLHKLQAILGEVRKAEKYVWNPNGKEYQPKTDILTRQLPSKQSLDALVEVFKKEELG